jgi:chromosome segregation protein
MYLKRLTMKGFKSFADNTVLEFEPGVTAVVGPNGSGKSNVVDAVTWVLGAQSTRALRSAKMEDVIFVGTASRPALGRAEVALTIDNASGRLPIDGAEVTMSRTLFRSGDSEYTINGTPCRLLDVQELLSDSGVGRQQHMIIGQGQLDSVLNSRPEERRAVIEEAAGVSKHRRRKERAERRLAGTQENLERLGDLVREVRRQMRPLERQAVAARSYADVDRELREVRRYAFATRLGQFTTRQCELEEELRAASTRERELRHELVTLDAQSTAAAAEMASRREELLASTLGQLQALAERARGTTSLIAERQRSLVAALAASADENVIATLEADAARLSEDVAALSADETALDAPRRELTDAESAFADAAAQYETTWGAASATNPAAELANVREQQTILERSVAGATDLETRTAARVEAASRRLAQLLDSREATFTGLGEARRALEESTRERATAESEAASAETKRQSADDVLREATDVAARTQARAEALARALEELSGSGSRALLSSLEGVLGSFLDLIDVDAGAERAVESAAGAAVSATVVDGRRSARAALEALRRGGRSRPGAAGSRLRIGRDTRSRGHRRVALARSAPRRSTGRCRARSRRPLRSSLRRRVVGDGHRRRGRSPRTRHCHPRRRRLRVVGLARRLRSGRRHPLDGRRGRSGRTGGGRRRWPGSGASRRRQRARRGGPSASERRDDGRRSQRSRTGPPGARAGPHRRRNRRAGSQCGPPRGRTGRGP